MQFFHRLMAPVFLPVTNNGQEPLLDPAFVDWMNETFGASSAAWSVTSLYENVRSSFQNHYSHQYAPGNRGGWVKKTRALVFNFHNDGDAMVFKIKMHDTLISKESTKSYLGGPIYRSYYYFPRNTEQITADIISEVSDLVDD